MKNICDYKQAHTHCANHRDEIERSKICGCFYCLDIFPAIDIIDWIDPPPNKDVSNLSDKEENAIGSTALCPKCGIDSVLGDKSGYLIDKDFLEAMHKIWFDN